MNKIGLKIGFATAVSLVIANMIGTGVFTSLGFQVTGVHTFFAVLMLWIIGGVMALCGALVYGEIGAAFPQSGGEYNYLSKLYHPLVGFLSGWVSSTVGFAAPVALAAMALGKYVQSVFPSVDPTISAIAVLIILTCLHATDLKAGAGVQRIFTFFKVAFIVFFIGAGLMSPYQQEISVLPQEGSYTDIFANGAFAVSLFWVSYSYSGWNAAAYMTGEIEDPNRNLPRSLFFGTLIVSVLYVLLNYVFLLMAPVSELAGQVEIGHIAAKHIFGDSIGNVMGIIISLLLVSSISAMVMVGPRVVSSIGEELKLLNVFSKKNKNGVPYVAVIFQSLIALVLILTAKFNEVLELIGFTLSLFTTLTVFGVFILRTKFKTLERPYKTLGYPLTPIIFLIINMWILYYGFTSKMSSSLYGLAIVAAGAVVWLAGNANKQKSIPQKHE
jgi:APA family basic amino acid/polyamine antiporter